jgi:hypothetical protein
MRCGAAVLLMTAVAFVGCGGGEEETVAEKQSIRAVPAVPEEIRKPLLDGAISVLRRLDDFEESAAYEQVFDRLNQWSHANVVDIEWEPDPLLETLPDRFRDKVSPQGLAGSTFDSRDDLIFLRDQRWLADLADSISGDAVDDLDIAVRLFNWTVRSLALVSDPPMQVTEDNQGSRWFLPGEILLAGRASSAQRCWIFLELLRHAGLNGVMLATGSGQGPEATLVPWIPGLVSGGEVWLFDPVYGTPIPGPDGQGIATARQAFENPAVLEQMDVDGRSYPVRSEDVGQLGVLVAALPANLSRRMLLVERSLVGTNAMSLAVRPSEIAQLAAAGLPQTSSPVRSGMWAFPWDTARMRQERKSELQAEITRELAPLTVQLPEPSGNGQARLFRPLFAARVREFRGELDGRLGAKFAYLAARPSDSKVRGFVATMPPQQADLVRRLVGQMKEDATYFLGVVTLQEGEYEASIDFLERMTLEASPDGRWADAAKVNAAFAYAALGQTEIARRLFEADESPQRFGSRLAAARLTEDGDAETDSP